MMMMKTICSDFVALDVVVSRSLKKIMLIVIVLGNFFSFQRKKVFWEALLRWYLKEVVSGQQKIEFFEETAVCLKKR